MNRGVLNIVRSSGYLIVLLFAGFIISPSIWSDTPAGQKEEITLVTYYPVPYGDYRKMRLWPTELTSNEVCDSNSEGTLYYNKDTGQAMLCRRASLDTYAWSAIGGPPIGTIEAWHKSMSGTPGLPDGWVECNGQTINDPNSPYNGQVVPDLNSDKQTGTIDSGLFLRGASTSGTLQEDGTAINGLKIPYSGYSCNYLGGWVWVWWGPGSSSSYCRSNSAHWGDQPDDGNSETRPANMTVVWIIRIK